MHAAVVLERKELAQHQTPGTLLSPHSVLSPCQISPVRCLWTQYSVQAKEVQSQSAQADCPSGTPQQGPHCPSIFEAIRWRTEMTYCVLSSGLVHPALEDLRVQHSLTV